ncbi:MAG: hypothetical protein AB7O88_27020 [Reyranellaceae bacterium]
MLNLIKIAVAVLACLVAGDIAGVFGCLLLDLVAGRSWSGALPYVVWFVVGVFTGLFTYTIAGGWTATDSARDWTEQPGAARRGALIVGIALAIMLALGLLFYKLFWSRGAAGEYYVPDSAPHTIVFFVSVGASMLFFRSALAPSAGATR